MALVAVCAAVAVAWWVAARFLRPLRERNESAREISATNLHRRLGVAGPDDELTELGRTLDGLFGRLEGSFATHRRFVANASHELRTPLAGQHTVLQVSLAPAPASGDTSLIESLVANSLDNALEYNVPGGTVEVATSRSGAESRVAVTNTGPVVAAVDVGRRFGAFQRLETDRTSRSSGHGLGLAIVKAIADAHGAVVTAVARPQGGLHVVVSLPDVVASAG